MKYVFLNILMVISVLSFLYFQVPTVDSDFFETEDEILSCGQIGTYSDSLKYKMRDAKQENLLRDFTKVYAPYEVPPTLKEWIKFEEKTGADSYVISFFLEPESKKEFFKYAFSEDEKINDRVMESFLPLANIDGTGSSVALWTDDGNITDLEHAPIIELGSEGYIGIVAKNMKDLLYMMSMGIEPYEGVYDQYDEDEEYYRREGFGAFRGWLEETMKIEPVDNWKIEGTPPKLKEKHEEAKKLYEKRFFKWLYRFIPDPAVVQAKYEKEQYEKLSKIKKELEEDQNKTSKSYCLLAENARGLRYIGKAKIEDEKAYYLKALELDRDNIDILFKLADLDITDEESLQYYKQIEKIAKDPSKTPLYYQFAITYGYLDDDEKSLEYYKKHIALNPRPNNYGDSDLIELCEKLDIDPIKVYEDAVKVAKNQLNYETLYDMYMKKHDFDSAMSKLEELFKIKTLKEFEYAVWGGDFEDVGSNAYALRVYEEGIKKLDNPKDQAYLAKKSADVYEKDDDKEGVKKYKLLAISFYEKALEHETSDEKKINFYVEISDLYSELNMYEKSLEYLQKAVEIETDDEKLSEHYYYMAQSYGKMHQYKKALEYAKKSLALTPKDKYSIKQVKEFEEKI